MPWEKYRVRIQAVHVSAAMPPVFARESAAQIMGLPIIGVPRDVQTVVTRGNSGGQSNRGVHRINAVEGDPPPWEMFGLLLTPPPQTARDLAVRLPLAGSLPCMDKLLQQQALDGSPSNTQGCFTADDVLCSNSLLPHAIQRLRVERVLSVADPLPESAGESFSRAIMIQHGFLHQSCRFRSQTVGDSSGTLILIGKNSRHPASSTAARSTQPRSI